MPTDGVIQKYLDGLKSRELLLKLTWDEWLAIGAPYQDGEVSIAEVTTRYQLYNEKIAYLWLWTLKAGYFGS